MLYVTVPPLYNQELFEEIASAPEVDVLRYNTGMSSPHAPEKTLELLMHAAERYGKKLWIDLKCRQLRIIRWSVAEYGKIRLNHRVKVSGRARVHFRGDTSCELQEVRGDVIYVTPRPQRALGDGQALNIVGGEVTIEGYLLAADRRYLAAGQKLGHRHFMLSFVECQEDISQTENAFWRNEKRTDELELMLKIESQKGLAHVRTMSEKELARFPLMAARDDLYVNMGDRKSETNTELKKIIARSPEAVCASRIFSGIEMRGEPQLADFADLDLMSAYGYKHFMFSDGLCMNHFRKALTAWNEWRSAANK